MYVHRTNPLFLFETGAFSLRYEERYEEACLAPVVTKLARNIVHIVQIPSFSLGIYPAKCKTQRHSLQIGNGILSAKKLIYSIWIPQKVKKLLLFHM
jgi:hypothetical protein